jgi:hypothetical protein
MVFEPAPVGCHLGPLHRMLAGIERRLLEVELGDLVERGPAGEKPLFGTPDGALVLAFGPQSRFRLVHGLEADAALPLPRHGEAHPEVRAVASGEHHVRSGLASMKDASFIGSHRRQGDKSGANPTRPIRIEKQ